MSKQRRRRFRVTRFQTPITTYPLKSSVQTGIQYSDYFESWTACVAARLDLEKWDSGGYPPKFMARVVAWHRLSGLVDVHKDQARNEAAERQSKRKGKK